MAYDSGGGSDVPSGNAPSGNRGGSGGGGSNAPSGDRGGSGGGSTPQGRAPSVTQGSTGPGGVPANSTPSTPSSGTTPGKVPPIGSEDPYTSTFTPPTTPDWSTLDPQKYANTAKDIAQQAQQGATRAAISGARSTGLNAGLSAIAGANAASGTYGNVLPSIYGETGQLALGKTGQQSNFNLGASGQQNQFKIQQQQQQLTNMLAQQGYTQKQGQWIALLIGQLLSGAGLLKHAERGADAIGFERGGDKVEAIVGENGPERVLLPKGASVIPNIKDGYDMLAHVVKYAKNGKHAETPRGVSIDDSNKGVATLSMIDALNDKVEKVMKYMQKVGA